MYFQLHNIFIENNYFLPNLGGKAKPNQNKTTKKNHIDYMNYILSQNFLTLIVKS